MSFSGRFFPFFVLVSVLKTIINIYLSHFSSKTFHIHMQIPRHRTNFTYTCEKEQPHRRSFVSDDPASFGDYYTSLIIVISVHVRFQQMHQVCGLSGHSNSKRVFSLNEARTKLSSHTMQGIMLIFSQYEITKRNSQFCNVISYFWGLV